MKKEKNDPLDLNPSKTKRQGDLRQFFILDKLGMVL